MNVDPYRERCQVENVQPGRLRRVSFCVDVQIASAAPVEDDDLPEKPTFGDTEEPEVPPSMDQYFREYKPEQIDKLPSKKKSKEASLKTKDMSEGDAMKNPETLAQAKDEPDGLELPNVDDTQALSRSPDDAGDSHQSSKKKEKKKRSEEERKERKEKRKRQAVANGTVPIEITMDVLSAGTTSGESSPPLTQQSKPTTDPLRVYKRCCQLRETHALKKIADQLSSTSSGTIQCLDLSGLRFQLPDVVTFGDFLAIVPIRRLYLSDCALTDEALRVILAGLLSVKTPQQADFNRNLGRSSPATPKHGREQFGVIEKLCLKGNAKIGREGWRHLSFFIHMSQSIKSVDLTGIPFPHAFSHVRSNSHGQNSAKSPGGSKTLTDMSTIFGECMAKRLNGSRLEELILADCELQAEEIEKVVDAFITCGGKRLSVARNNLTEQGVEAVVRYLESSKCEALDVGGNDLTKLSGVLIAAITRTAESNPLYYLNLEDCKITAPDLRAWLSPLTTLTNLRFLDLSHNRQLFSEGADTVCLLRRYLPRMRILKRLNIDDVALQPEQCIAIAEILPEVPYFAHIRYVTRMLHAEAVKIVVDLFKSAGKSGNHRFSICKGSRHSGGSMRAVCVLDGRRACVQNDSLR